MTNDEREELNGLSNFSQSSVLGDTVGFEDGGVGFGDFGVIEAFDVVMRKEFEQVVGIGVRVESADDIVELFDANAVDSVHEHFAARVEIRVDGIGKDGG